MSAQPAFVAIPEPRSEWHASRWLGIKNGLHIITRRPANLPQQFVPMCLGGALVRARMYIVHSRTSETRWSVHWLYSKDTGHVSRIATRCLELLLIPDCNKVR